MLASRRLYLVIFFQIYGLGWKLFVSGVNGKEKKFYKIDYFVSVVNKDKKAQFFHSPVRLGANIIKPFTAAIYKLS